MPAYEWVPEASAVDIAVSAAASALAEVGRRERKNIREAVRERRQALRKQLVDEAIAVGEAEAAYAELMRGIVSSHLEKLGEQTYEPAAT